MCFCLPPFWFERVGDLEMLQGGPERPQVGTVIVTGQRVVQPAKPSQQNGGWSSRKWKIQFPNLLASFTAMAMIVNLRYFGGWSCEMLSKVWQRPGTEWKTGSLGTGKGTQLLTNVWWHVCVPSEQMWNCYFLAGGRGIQSGTTSKDDELCVPAPIFPFVMQATKPRTTKSKALLSQISSYLQPMLEVSVLWTARLP